MASINLCLKCFDLNAEYFLSCKFINDVLQRKIIYKCFHVHMNHKDIKILQYQNNQYFLLN